MIDRGFIQRPFKPDTALRGDTYLIRQHVSTEVAERQLQLLQALVHRDLDSDEGVGGHIVGVVRDLGSHRG